MIILQVMARVVMHSSRATAAGECFNLEIRLLLVHAFVGEQSKSCHVVAFVRLVDDM